MNRPPLSLYVIAALEFTAGSILAWGGIDFIRYLAGGRRPRTDDLLAASALAPPGICILLAAIAVLLAQHLPRGIVRGARLAAMLSEVWMMLAGAAIYWVAKRQGGDWAGIGYLAGTILLVIGGFLLLLSWLGFRWLRRLGSAPESSRDQRPG